MAGDDAAITAQRLSAARARPSRERAAHGAVLEAAALAAADELGHAAAPVCSNERLTPCIGPLPAPGDALPRGTPRLRPVEFAERLSEMSPRSSWAILLVTLAASACGGSAVSYSGESRAPHIDPGALPATPPALIAKLLRSPLVQRQPALRALLMRHPNAGSEARRKG